MDTKVLLFPNLSEGKSQPPEIVRPELLNTTRKDFAGGS